eukprot:14293355-Alexandrium_andersonii.AAC.1
MFITYLPVRPAIGGHRFGFASRACQPAKTRGRMAGTVRKHAPAPRSQSSGFRNMKFSQRL